MKKKYFYQCPALRLDIPIHLYYHLGTYQSNDKKRSGLSTHLCVRCPSFKGIGLHNLGWFQYINDYVTTTLSADIFASAIMPIIPHNIESEMV